MADADENEMIAPEAAVPEEVAAAPEAPPSDEVTLAAEVSLPEEVDPTPEASEPEETIPVQLLRLVPTVGEPEMNDPRLDGSAIVEAALARQAADEG